MKVKECMTTEVELADPKMTLVQAAKKMKEGDFGFMPIGENDRLVGVVTDRDIAIRAVADGMDPNQTTIREVASKRLLYCFEQDSIEEVADNMSRNQVRRLPVLNAEKRLVGVVSLGDLAVCHKADQKVEDALAHISEPSGEKSAPRTLM